MTIRVPVFRLVTAAVLMSALSGAAIAVPAGMSAGAVRLGPVKVVLTSALAVASDPEPSPWNQLAVTSDPPPQPWNQLSAA